MKCPKCGHEQPGRYECERCGVVFSKWNAVQAAEKNGAEPESDSNLPSPLEQVFGNAEVLLLDQDARDWSEILLDWEVANQYSITDSRGKYRGTAVEQGRSGGDIVKRQFMGSRRPLHIVVFNQAMQPAIEIDRPFTLLLTRMEVKCEGRVIGGVERKFNLLRRTYELKDQAGRMFAMISSPLLRFYTFPIYDRAGREKGQISKKWRGFGLEALTDADKFRIQFLDDSFTTAQRAIVLAAALAIDFDFYENNQKR